LRGWIRQAVQYLSWLFFFEWGGGGVVGVPSFIIFVQYFPKLAFTCFNFFTCTSMFFPSKHVWEWAFHVQFFSFLFYVFHKIWNKRNECNLSHLLFVVVFLWWKKWIFSSYSIHYLDTSTQHYDVWAIGIFSQFVVTIISIYLYIAKE
jgi:hypothetical protein